MKISKKEFIKVIEPAVSILGVKSSIPMMGSLHFINDCVFSMSSDIFIKSTFPAGTLNFDKSFSTVVGRDFYNLVKRLPTDELDLNYSPFCLSIKAGNSLTELAVFNWDIQPHIDYLEKGEKERQYKPLPDTFSDDVTVVSYSAAEDVVNEALHCIHFCDDYIEALSGHKMTRKKYYAEVSFEKPFLIKLSAIPYITKINPTKYCIENDSVIFINDNGVCLRYILPYTGDSNYISKEQLDGFVKPLPIELYLPEEFLDAVSRAYLVAQTDKTITPCVGVHFSGDKIELSVVGRSDFGKMYETLYSKQKNKEMTVWLPVSDFYSMYRDKDEVTISEDYQRIVMRNSRFEHTLMMMKPRHSEDPFDFKEVQED